MKCLPPGHINVNLTFFELVRVFAIVLVSGRRRVFRMAKGETEIFCDLDQKNGKRKSYKKARVSLKSVLNSEFNEE